MSSPTEIRPGVENQEFSDIVAALILDPPATESPPTKELPAPREYAPQKVVYVDRYPPEIASPLFETSERFWDGDAFWLAILATKYLGIMGIIATLGYFVIWPVVTFLAIVGPTLIAMGITAVVIFWATQLMGFWDHTRPVQSRKTKAVPATRLVTHSPPAPVVKKAKASAVKKPRVMLVENVPSPMLAHATKGRKSVCGEIVPRNARRVSERHTPKCQCCVSAIDEADRINAQSSLDNARG
jgi:hypothetical protein